MRSSIDPGAYARRRTCVLLLGAGKHACKDSHTHAHTHALTYARHDLTGTHSRRAAWQCAHHSVLVWRAHCMAMTDPLPAGARRRLLQPGRWCVSPFLLRCRPSPPFRYYYSIYFYHCTSLLLLLIAAAFQVSSALLRRQGAARAGAAQLLCGRRGCGRGTSAPGLRMQAQTPKAHILKRTL